MKDARVTVTYTLLLKIERHAAYDGKDQENQPLQKSALTAVKADLPGESSSKTIPSTR